jgi:poly-beta-1,6-N-acetyl-D-glucosamine synthase
MGWETLSFPDLKMIHAVKTNAKGGIIRGEMRSGRVEYLIGTHPLFMGLKSLKHIFKNPFVLGSIAEMIGYVVPAIRKEEHAADADTVNYIRREQIQRLKHFITLLNRWKAKRRG